jgi:hypothetical protein
LDRIPAVEISGDEYGVFVVDWQCFYLPKFMGVLAIPPKIDGVDIET